MRLTLRTLLAYLDDVLSPESTADIGQKIQESPMAQLLVSRIREVMRRRRLKSPDVFGPEMGIDPNIIAAYLDNTLPAEQYADVERVLLASDELLAETASCHQVLALALGETNEIPPSSRERLYALGPVDAESQLAVAIDTDLELKSRTPLSVSTRVGSTKTRDAAPLPHEVDPDSVATVPDYLKPTPWGSRVVPGVLVALLLIVCGVLVLPPIRNAMQQANNEFERKAARENVAGIVQDAKPVEQQHVDSVDSEPKKVATDSVDIAANQEPTGSSEKSRPKTADPNTLGDDLDDLFPPDEPPAKEPKTETKAPATSLPAPLPPKEESTPEPSSTSDQTPLPIEIMADLQIPYTSVEGILIRRDKVKQHWYVVPRQSFVQPDERIANLDPFDGRLEFEKGNVRVTMVGESVLELLRPTWASLQGIDIGRGRFLFQSKLQNTDEPATIAIKIGEDIWKLQLMSIETVCALEVRIEPPFQFEKRNEQRWYQASLYVVSGSAKWMNSNGKTFDLNELNALEVVPERISDVSSAPMAVPYVPEWCDPAKRRLQPTMKRIQSVFEKAFDVNQPVDESMLTVVSRERTPKVAGLAAHTLSAMDNYAALVQTLATCDHEEARFAARDGLRQWLPMNPANGPRLMQALQKHYSDVDAEILYRMLWGFSREEIKTSLAKSLQFTMWMSSPKLEIRELAEYWVKQLTGRSIEYKAGNSQPIREAQVRRLEEMIHRNNGLIKNP